MTAQTVKPLFNFSRHLSCFRLLQELTFSLVITARGMLCSRLLKGSRTLGHKKPSNRDPPFEAEAWMWGSSLGVMPPPMYTPPATISFKRSFLNVAARARVVPGRVSG